MDLSNYTIYTILSYLSISPTSSDLPSFTLLSTSSNGTVQSYLQTVLMILLHTSEEEITKVGFMPKMGVGVEGAGKEVLRGVYDEIYKSTPSSLSSLLSTYKTLNASYTCVSTLHPPPPSNFPSLPSPPSLPSSVQTFVTAVFGYTVSSEVISSVSNSTYLMSSSSPELLKDAAGGIFFLGVAMAVGREIVSYRSKDEVAGKFKGLVLFRVFCECVYYEIVRKVKREGRRRGEGYEQRLRRENLINVMSICGDMTSSGGLIRDFFWGCEELEGGNSSKPVEERGGLDVDCFCVDPANIDVHFNDVLDDFFSENGDDDVNDEEGWNESQPVLFGDDDNLPTMTALHLSCQNGNYPVVEFLCGRLEYEGGKRGGMADVNLSDRNGWTPAHFACVGKDEVAACKILKCLKKAGADLMREAGNGYTPYALVKRLGGNQEICDCLEEMGAGVFHNPGQTSFFFQKNFGEVFESGVETAKEMLMGAGGQNNEEG